MRSLPLGSELGLVAHSMRRRLALPRRQPLPAGLLVGLKEWWSCEDVAPTYASCIGSYRRTVMNVPYGYQVARADGPPGSGTFALQNTAFNGVTASAGDAYWGMGDTDYTMCCWAMRQTGTAAPYPFSVRVGGDAYNAYGLQMGTNFNWYCSPNGSSSYYAYYPYTITNGVWYFLMGRHDSVNNLLTISVNNGLYAASSAYSLGGRSSSGLYVLIGASEGALARACTVNRCGIWNRLLTADEEAFLWGSGIGRGWPFYL